MTREEELAIAQKNAPKPQELAELARRDAEIIEANLVFVETPDLFEQMIRLAQAAEPPKPL